MKRFAVAVVLTATLALAQGPRMRGFRAMQMGQGPQAPSTDQVKSYLALTDAQVTQLQQIRQDEFTANQSLHQQIADKQTALQTALAGTSPAATDLGNLLLDIKNLRAQMKQNREKFQTQAVALLTDAQKPKLQALQDAASLEPTIRQATMLNLITPPTPPDGDVIGPMGGPGRGMRMMGPGPRR